MTTNTAGFQECAAAPDTAPNPVPGVAPGAPADAGRATAVSLLLEQDPAALARVAAVLCTLGVVPASLSGRAAGSDALQLDLAFRGVAPGRVDLLLRKLAQLIDCIEIQHLPES